MASSPSIACPACSEPVSISDDCIVRYFDGKPERCGQCGAELDWWAAACREMASSFTQDKALALAGGRETADESWDSMVEAFESYSQQRYDSMIVPACAAVELSLSGLLSRRLPSLVSQRRADNEAAGPHHLDVLLPLVAHYHGIPYLPRDIHAALDKLRALRTDLELGGVACSTLDASAAAELLCGALFGVRYLRYVEGRLAPSVSA
jgi:hypothetical protein